MYDERKLGFRNHDLKKFHISNILPQVYNMPTVRLFTG